MQRENQPPLGDGLHSRGGDVCRDPQGSTPAWQGTPIGSECELEAVYGSLRRAAQALLANERTGVSIQATSLVHEAWVRLRDHDGRWTNERHYFHTAVRAMRRYLIDRARERNALRRGGDRQRIDASDLDWSRIDMPVLREVPDDRLPALDEAIAKLESAWPRAAEIAQLRWIAGLTIEQVAEVIGVSTDTVKRDWRFARAMLRSHLLEPGTQPDPSSWQKR